MKCIIREDFVVAITVDRKVPEIPIYQGSGSGFENLRKIPKKSRLLNPENLKIPGIRIWIWKSRLPLKILSFYGFLTIGIFRDFWQISGIRDFSSFRDFYPRFFRKIPRIWDFFGIFTFEIGIFFRGMGYPDKKPTLVSNYVFKLLMFFANQNFVDCI